MSDETRDYVGSAIRVECIDTAHGILAWCPNTTVGRTTAALITTQHRKGCGAAVEVSHAECGGGHE